MKNKEDLYQIQEEIADRYGKLTQEAKNLILTHRIRVEAKPLGVLKIDAGEDSIIFTFKDKPSFDPESSSACFKQTEICACSGRIGYD